jgi:hypothetical protein
MPIKPWAIALSFPYRSIVLKVIVSFMDIPMLSSCKTLHIPSYYLKSPKCPIRAHN